MIYLGLMDIASKSTRNPYLKFLDTNYTNYHELQQT